jgi:hypothetical protein
VLEEAPVTAMISWPADEPVLRVARPVNCTPLIAV